VETDTEPKHIPTASAATKQRFRKPVENIEGPT
jgi:hypothetical protein